MSVTLTRIVNNGAVDPAEPRRDLDALQDQLSVDTGVICEGVSLRVNYDPAGDPGKDHLTLVFASSPSEVTLDTSLAAFPKLPAAAGSQVSTAPNTDYTIYSRTIQVGEVVGFDVHVLVAFGSVANMEVALLDQYIAVYRRSSGNVRVVGPEGATPGSVPGLRLTVTGGPTTATIALRVQRSGTLHILHNEVEIYGQGTVPA